MLKSLMLSMWGTLRMAPERRPLPPECRHSLGDTACTQGLGCRVKTPGRTIPRPGACEVHGASQQGLPLRDQLTCGGLGWLIRGAGGDPTLDCSFPPKPSRCRPAVHVGNGGGQRYREGTRPYLRPMVVGFARTRLVHRLLVCYLMNFENVYPV